MKIQIQIEITILFRIVCSEKKIVVKKKNKFQPKMPTNKLLSPSSIVIIDLCWSPSGQVLYSAEF